MAEIITSNKLQITETDFDTIKASLKAFLQSQTEFSDFNFDGSGIQVILNILAYNTHFIAFYANMLANESFIDSAVVRDSIVSIAKHLNYTPTSVTSPTATIDIDFTGVSGSPPSITIDKNTIFNTTIDGIAYKYINTSSVIVVEDGGNYIATAVPIREGTLLEFDITVDLSDGTQRFIIPNINVDLSTVLINIQNSATDSTIELWTKTDTVTNTTATDKVYWVQEVEDLKYELIFGNNVVGKSLKDANIIKIEYLVTNGIASNTANVFTAVGAVAGESAFTITTNSIASGGADIESNESIKFLAPKLFSTQGRAVTKNDYKNILLNNRSDIESITAWGGEEEIPPQFGKVFIAAKPFDQDIFSNFDKTVMSTILTAQNVVSIQPQFVDPVFTYINIESEIFYNDLTLQVTLTDLQSQIDTVVRSYFTSNLNIFEQPFRYSVLTKSIDESNIAILNNDTAITIEQRFKPSLNLTQSFTLEFNNSIVPGTLTSSQYGIDAFSDVFMDDDLNGNIRSIRTVAGTKIILEELAGTIDYTTGKIIISNIAFVSIPADGNIKVIVTPTNNKLNALREQIFTSDTTDANSLSITLTKDLK